MTALQVIARFLMNALRNPVVVDTLSQVGRYAARQATAQIIRSINQNTKPRRNSPQIIK